MTQQEIYKAVRAEVRAIKKHATEKELNQLSIELLDPINVYNCIYGLMTGSCHCDRAKHLIKQCSLSYVVSAQGRLIKAKALLDEGHYRNFSTLEWFIINEPEHNKHIIDYLTDKVKHLRIY
jgi:hypothetical protein